MVKQKEIKTGSNLKKGSKDCAWAAATKKTLDEYERKSPKGKNALRKKVGA